MLESFPALNSERVTKGARGHTGRTVRRSGIRELAAEGAQRLKRIKGDQASLSHLSWEVGLSRGIHLKR